MMVSIIIIIIIIIHTIIAITTTTNLIVLLKSLVMITLAVFGLLILSSMTATPHIITSVASNTGTVILSLPCHSYMVITCITMLSNPAAFFGAMLPIKPHIITMFALGESYAGHFVCKCVGAAPPPTLPLFKDHGCLQKKTSRRHHRCLHQKTNQITSIRSSLCGSFMFALGESYAGHFVCKWGGCAPPNPPLFKGHGCLQKKKKNKGQDVTSIDACKKTSIRSSPCGSFMFRTCGKLHGSFCLQMGGAAPAFQRLSMLEIASFSLFSLFFVIAH